MSHKTFKSSGSNHQLIFIGELGEELKVVKKKNSEPYFVMFIRKKKNRVISVVFIVLYTKKAGTHHE